VFEIVDEGLKVHDGDVDRATRHLLNGLVDLEAGGIDWAIAEMQAALLVGLKAIVARRKRAQRVVVGSDPMPANYTTSNGLVSWLDAPIADLDLIIDRLDKRSGSLEDHAGILVRARDLAQKHGVDTAADAYRAEGIAVIELAS
jgi:hypothetical protein